MFTVRTCEFLETNLHLGGCPGPWPLDFQHSEASMLSPQKCVHESLGHSILLYQVFWMFLHMNFSSVYCDLPTCLPNLKAIKLPYDVTYLTYLRKTHLLIFRSFFTFFVNLFFGWNENFQAPLCHTGNKMS